MLTNLRNRFERLSGEKEQLTRQFKEQTKEKAYHTRQEKIAERARNIVRAVALQTQQQLEYQISSVVTAAQETVFDEPYGLVARFEERRGKTECDLLFSRDDQEFDPLASSGYGAVDVAAFALRVACWSMGRDTAPVLLLDEPFKHLKGEESNRRAIQMVQEIAVGLGVQVIMISDERAPREDIVAGADRVFEVTLQNGVSQVEVVE